MSEFERIARALCRHRIVSNLRFEPSKANDLDFVQRCEDASWSDREWLDMAHAVLAGGRQVRHKVRGSTYQVLGEAEVQVSISDSVVINTIGMPNGRILQEGQKLTVYRCDITGKLCARFPDEFEDGRFADVAPAQGKQS